MSPLRSAWRQLRKNPFSSLTILLMLAVGVGVNTAVFSIVDAVLLKPLPYPRGEQLVMVWNRYAGRGDDRAFLSPPELDDLERLEKVFDRLGAYSGRSYVMDEGSWPVRLLGVRVTPGFFPTFEIPAQLGRVFTSDISEEGCAEERQVVLSHGLWQRSFGGRREVLGEKVSLSGETYEILGVMPAGFSFPRRAELWTLACLDPASSTYRRGNEYLRVVARLAPAVDLGQADAALATHASRLRTAHPEAYPEEAGFSQWAMPLRELDAADQRPLMLAIFAVVGFVLLITCSNIAMLLVVRATHRSTEITTRLVLGADLRTLARQLSSEGLVLALFGGMLGAPVAMAARELLLRFAGEALSSPDSVVLDLRVLGFTLAVAVITGAFFGSIPLAHAARLRRRLASSGPKATAGRGRIALLYALLVVEIALSVTLLVGAGLTVRSIQKLLAVDPGFISRNVLEAEIDLSHRKFQGGDLLQNVYDEVLLRASSLPNVDSVATISGVPLGGMTWELPFVAEGVPRQPGQASPSANIQIASPGYFDTLRIPLRRGRPLETTDRGDAQAVAVVDEKLARDVWPKGEIVGRRIRLGEPEEDTPWLTVVGVVGEVRHEGLDAPPLPHVYLPFPQFPVRVLHLMIRSSSPPESLFPALRKAVAEVDPDLVVEKASSLENLVAHSHSQRSFAAALLSFFAFLGFAAASFGVYGVTACVAAQRRREIGIRTALGASVKSLRSWMMGKMSRAIATGLLLGLGLAFAGSRFLTSLLYAIPPSDVPSYAGALLLVSLVALLAAYVPARKAARLDAAQLLREE